MIRFEDLLERVRSYTSDEEREFLRRAYVFSALEHKGQVRHSGEPYLVHPLEVASILAEMRLDPVAIASGLLHDVVEDTLTTIEKIQEHFGPEVAHVVEGVTKISAITFSSSEERQAENFRKMLLAMVDDIRVILVKLADRVHNMRTLSHLPEERRVRVAEETRDIYAPIANRLGMSKVKNELEELAFRYLEPQSFESLHLVAQARRALELETLARGQHLVAQRVHRTVVRAVEEAAHQPHTLVVLGRRASADTRPETFLDLVANAARRARIDVKELRLIGEVHRLIEPAITKAECVVELAHRFADAVCTVERTVVDLRILSTRAADDQ